MSRWLRLTPTSTVVDLTMLCRTCPCATAPALALRLERALERDVTPDGRVGLPLSLVLDLAHALQALAPRWPQARRAWHELLLLPPATC